MAGTKARVTISDVAAASGVSRATVSFVLRDSPGQTISAATRERVRQTARDLGYVPHPIARALREGTSRIVVLIIDAALDGNYARSYVAGLDAELAARDHVLVVRYSHRETARPAPPAQAAHPAPQPQRVSPAQAALAAQPSLDDHQAQQDQLLIDTLSPRAVLRFGEPYLTGHELDDSGGGWRDGLAAHVAAQLGHLASRGHRRIALALPDRDTPLRGVRQRFADQAAAGLGLPPLPPVTLPGSKSNSHPSYRTVPADSLARFLAGNPGVTAVAAFDDDEALRVLAAMRSLGLGAPADLAVIGFDDNGYGALTSPTLTTVHIDAEAHGRQAARAVLGLDASDLSPAPGQVIVRDST
jgi:DNA-binding LacI/PurR family transcriptional regulator